MRDPHMAAALALTFVVAVRETPLSRATTAVMILVVLAMARRSSGNFSKSTRPVSESMRKAA